MGDNNMDRVMCVIHGQTLFLIKAKSIKGVQKNLNSTSPLVQTLLRLGKRIYKKPKISSIAIKR